MKKNNDLILVYYISTSNVRSEDITEYMNEVMCKINIETMKGIGEIIVIPVNGESRIECINPKFITNNELIIKHDTLMSELNENLSNEIKILKK